MKHTDDYELRISQPRPDFSLTAVFILALIYTGQPITNYEMQKLGFSSGAIVPTLEKLHKMGVIARSSNQSEARDSYLTKDGKRILEDAWFSFLMRPAKNVAETLRIAWIALAVGKDEIAGKFLRQSARVRIDFARRLQGKTAAKTGSLAERYRIVLDAVKSATWLAEAQVLQNLANEITPTTDEKTAPPG
jgi:DNA-binding PadR family transcriptional regulator